MTAGPAQSILLVEDSPSLARVYMEYLQRESVDVTHVETGNGALALLAERTFDAILLDLRLPDINGIEVLDQLKARRISTATVVITAHGSVNVAVDAMRAGAIDFLMKPFNADRLKVTLFNAIERQALRKVVESLQQEFDRDGYFGFIGTSLPMQSIYQIIDNAGPSKATVFITGESGTGKEICAEAIHRKSSRAKGPFITLNCAAIPKELIESEIFGHTKGAFTGAISDREGAAALADGGTLFLDEVCEMDLRLQTKLLRFIQTGTIQKVGGARLQPVDVRFICATNRNPLKAVEDGEFREDLYYRLHVVPIHMPPLRDRGNDVDLISKALLQEFSNEEAKNFEDFDLTAREAIRSYGWPGNVRQLQNVIRNIVVLNNGPLVTLDMLPPPINQDSTQPRISEPSTPWPEDAPPAVSDWQPAGAKISEAAPSVAAVTDSHSEIRPLWMIEKDAIEEAIAKCDGNIPRAAAFLDISPSTIYRKRLQWSKLTD
jgi:DNA-binding NtrC family response regulator